MNIIVIQDIPVEAVSTIVKILNLTAIVYLLGGPFSVVFPKSKTIYYCHVTYFIRFYCSYTINVVGIGYAANSAQIMPNCYRVITVFLILCKLDLSHALTCLSKRSCCASPRRRLNSTISQLSCFRDSDVAAGLENSFGKVL